jgi:PTS system nitrogen regulatory IIA component
MFPLLEILLGKRPATDYASGDYDSTEWPPMKPLAQLLSSEDILLDLDVSTKKGVFEEVGRLFARRHGLPQTEVVDSLDAREKLGSTGLGQGVALPHARIKNLPQAVAAFVRLKMPIPFDAPDAKPVWAMLILLVPERATEEHLQILAELGQIFGDRDFRERLRMCDDERAAYRLLSDWPRS